MLKIVYADERQCYSAHLINSPVEIDGHLEDLAWQTIPKASGFRELTTDIRTDKQTYFRVGWDKEFLYIGIKCDEPDIDKVRADLRDGGELWTEDSVEIFIAPEYPNYVQLVINTIGSRNWLNGGDNWRTGVSRGQDFWVTEIKIPFTELGKTPTDRQEWRFNIARNITVFDSGGNRYTTWSLLKMTFHDINNFAYLRFIAQHLAPEEAMKITKELNKKDLNPLLIDLNDVIAKCQTDVAEFKREHSKEIDEGTLSKLEKDIADIKAIAKEDASYEKLNRTRLRAKALLEEILGIKLRVLLE